MKDIRFCFIIVSLHSVFCFLFRLIAAPVENVPRFFKRKRVFFLRQTIPSQALGDKKKLYNDMYKLKYLRRFNM